MNIALALQAYARNHNGEYPPAYTTAANGKPLHSWRTLILPYLEERERYDSIDFTKPWDDPANSKAFEHMPFVFRCPGQQDSNNHTTYLAVLTPNSCLRRGEGRSLADISDNPAQTLVVIEVDDSHAVPWMAPQDADENIFIGLGGPSSETHHRDGMNAAFADGHVEFLNSDTPAAQRLALISIAGGDDDVARTSK